MNTEMFERKPVPPCVPVDKKFGYIVWSSVNERFIVVGAIVEFEAASGSIPNRYTAEPEEN